MVYPYCPTEKWDVHTHTTLSPSTYDALGRFTSYEKFVRIRKHATLPCCAEMVHSEGRVQRVIEDNAYDGEVRIKDCDHHNVSMQVLSPTPMMIPDYVDNEHDAAEICRILNDDLAQTVAKFPNRFIALGALPMRFPDAAIKEMRRLKDDLGMPGVEINSNVDGMDVGHPFLYPIFEAANDMGMAVFLHPWSGFMEPQDKMLKNRMNARRNWRPWLIGMGLETAIAFDSMRCSSVHERLPGLRVLYAHGGGAFTGLIGRMEHGAYCRPDLFEEKSALDPYRTVRECGVYTDSLTHSPWAFETLLHTIGAGRIAMGSDYPYPLGEIDPFDAQSRKDPKGNLCPYEQTKKIYPGHMVENLPGLDTNMDDAWGHFPWIPRKDASGYDRDLPRLSDEQRQRILSGTAREWLGVGGA